MGPILPLVLPLRPLSETPVILRLSVFPVYLHDVLITLPTILVVAHQSPIALWLPSALATLVNRRQPQLVILITAFIFKGGATERVDDTQMIDLEHTLM